MTTSFSHRVQEARVDRFKVAASKSRLMFMALERRRWIRYTFLLLHSCYEIQVLILLRRSFIISIETISFYPGSYTYSYHYSPFPVKCHHLHLRSTEMFYAGTQGRLLRGSWLYEDHRLRVPILNCGGSRIEEHATLKRRFFGIGK